MDTLNVQHARPRRCATPSASSPIADASPPAGRGGWLCADFNPDGLPPIRRAQLHDGDDGLDAHARWSLRLQALADGWDAIDKIASK